MSVLIHNYRGFNIHFSHKNERFSYELDRGAWHEKQSYGTVKAAIDEFIKEAAKFEPFEVASPDEKGRRKIIAIRKDGRFVYEEKGKKEQFSDYNLNRWYLVNDELDKILATISIYRSDIEELAGKIETLKKSITSPSLKKLKEKYLPAQ